MNKKYRLKYLPMFERDLSQAASYISETLHNPESALKLIDETEKAIIKRSELPKAFEPLYSSKPRKNPYYKISVGNFYVLYVVIDDVMEVRRFIYNRRNIDSILP